MKSVPRSPFTTPLSRSARETEPRIRGILPWKKQRPPLLAPVLAVLILSCGGLAACQAQGGPSRRRLTRCWKALDRRLTSPVT